MYSDLMNLGTNVDFVNRVIFAVEKFCTYVQGEATDVTNHAMRLNWALLAMENPQSAAVKLIPVVLQNTTVQAQLGAIADADVQSAVESAIVTTINATPSYNDIFAVASDAVFQHRLQIAVAKFASYVLGEAPSTPNHANRYNWAKNAITSSVGVANSIAIAVCLDSNVSGALTGVSDASLQSAAEAQINTLFL